MGVLEDVMADDAGAFTDPDIFGEPLTYKPKAGGSRNINGIVYRDPPERLDSSGRVWRPKMEIVVRNDGTFGVTSAELNTGGDRITVSYRKGGTSADHLISGEPLAQDAGMVRLMIM